MADTGANPTSSGRAGGDPSGLAPKRRQALGSGRAGKVRSQLRKAVDEARAADRMTAEHEVRALLAERYAAIVDRAAAAGDGVELLRAGDKLLELLDTLPIRKTDGGEGGGSGDGGSPRGKLLSIMDGGPTVGDTADA